MNPIVEFLKQAERTSVTETAKQGTIKLFLPLAEQELSVFEASLPCPLPQETRELLRFARGFGGIECRLGRRFSVEEINFADLQGSGLEDVFPHAKELACDGCGNSWIVDLTRESKTFAPIFFSCHDPPVIVYQTDSLLHFVQEMVRGSNAPWQSQIGEVHGTLTTRIWSENPFVLSRSQCLAVGDSDLKAFAKSLDETWEFIDLRNPKMGDGYSWGRYGSKTLNKRYGDQRIFACQKQSLSPRFLNAILGRQRHHE